MWEPLKLHVSQYKMDDSRKLADIKRFLLAKKCWVVRVYSLSEDLCPLVSFEGESLDFGSKLKLILLRKQFERILWAIKKSNSNVFFFNCFDDDLYCALCVYI